MLPSFAVNPFQVFPKKDDEAEKAKERFFFVKKVAEEHHDYDIVHAIEDLLDAAVRYINCIVNFNFEREELKWDLGMETKFYQHEVKELDERRRRVHDALISQLSMVNRVLGKKYGWVTDKDKKGIIPVGGVFTLHHQLFNDRKIIGDWAWYLVSGIYQDKMSMRERSHLLR